MAGFVTNPPKTIYECNACTKSEWKDGLPWQYRGTSKAEPQPQQQAQTKLEPEE
jgi:hypothetical protein